MTNIVSETHAQPTPAEPLNAVAQEAEDILCRAELAIEAIEGGVDNLNSSMAELLLLAKYDLQDDQAKAEVEVAANDLGIEANELFHALSSHFRELRNWVAAAAADAEDED
jgi:hypothetical protein